MSYIYLATAYTGLEETSYKTAKRAVAIYTKEGKVAFSPIAHMHEAAKEHNLPKDWKFWKKFCTAMLEPAKELHIVLPIRHVTHTLSSVGVRAEFAFALYKNIPITFMQLFRGGIRPHPMKRQLMRIMSEDV